MRSRAVLLTALAASVVLGACAGEGTNAAEAVTGGDVDAGRAAIIAHGCASCHGIPGVPSVPNGMGRDLENFGDQLYIAGQLPNRPEELIRWIRNPQAVEPGTAMPNMGVTEEEARDIAAYLYDR